MTSWRGMSQASVSQDPVRGYKPWRQALSMWVLCSEFTDLLLRGLCRWSNGVKCIAVLSRRQKKRAMAES
jgi:hypothetical protein